MRARLLLVLLILTASLPASALASGDDVIQDCVDHEGGLSRTFTPAEYREAIDTIPTDVAQYFPTCLDAFRSALRSAGISGDKTGGGTSARSAWGAAPSEAADGSPAELPAEERSRIANLATGDNAARGAEAASAGPAAISAPLDLPTPLLAMALALALGLVVGVAGRPAAAVLRKRKGD
ncbi:MAG TPA: hypothetical protein PKB03_08640 [Baekduia sp.]|nr:hypothetical protein [Baekduia sp.]